MATVSARAPGLSPLSPPFQQKEQHLRGGPSSRHPPQGDAAETRAGEVRTLSRAQGRVTKHQLQRQTDVSQSSSLEVRPRRLQGGSSWGRASLPLGVSDRLDLSTAGVLPARLCRCPDFPPVSGPEQIGAGPP